MNNDFRKALDNYTSLMKWLPTLSEEELYTLLKAEREGRNRSSFITKIKERIIGRKVRAVKDELAGL